nr:response regulator transcription factor [Pedobacter panaciterrae]
MKKILYCEDQFELAEIVTGCLEHSGFQVDYCTNGAEAIKKYRLDKPDILILDIVMPELDGFRTAEKIRESDIDTPIIFVTAKTTTEDVVKGFEIGANDYVKKPYSIEELIVRVNSLLRNRQVPEVKTHQLGKYTFDPSRKKLEISDEIRKLSYRESELLRKLVESKNEIVKRKDILENLWDGENFFTSRSLDVFVSKLRGYLKYDKNIKIVNVRNAGYILLLPD